MLIQKTKRFKTKVKRTTVEGKFKLRTKALQAAVEEACYDPPRRADGSISLNADWLAENAPKTHKGLQLYLEGQKLDKILNTYLTLYSEVDHVFPRINVLRPRSGRMSYTNPGVQTIPKRRWGIRALFVPRVGHSFYKADYTAQELFTLCQAMLDLGIPKGPMWDCLTSDKDPHILGATKTLGKAYETITKDERQGQKVVAFGVPGGLGARKLAEYAFTTFGVKWTKDEAADRRKAFLAAFPDVDEYLQRLKRSQSDLLKEFSGYTAWEWQKALECGWNVIGHLCQSTDPSLRELGEKCSRAVPGVLRTGRVRSGARFTEVANSGFQGLAADVTKHAMWILWFECGITPVLQVHDELVIEVPKPHPTDPNAGAELQAANLKYAMCEAFRCICPDIGKYAKVEVEGPLDRWGPATDGEGNGLL